MHIEQFVDDNTSNHVDRLVVESQKEEFQAEHLFMIGAGVNCGRVARDYDNDPLQAPGVEYPIPFSAEVTETVLNGLRKIMNGPPAGYHGVKPEEARATYEELSSQLTSSELTGQET